MPRLCPPAILEIVSGVGYLLTSFLFGIFLFKKSFLSLILSGTLNTFVIVAFTIALQLLCRNNLDRLAWVVLITLNFVIWGVFIFRVIMRFLRGDENEEEEVVEEEYEEEETYEDEEIYEDVYGDDDPPPSQPRGPAPKVEPQDVGIGARWRSVDPHRVRA